MAAEAKTGKKTDEDAESGTTHMRMEGAGQQMNEQEKERFGGAAMNDRTPHSTLGARRAGQKVTQDEVPVVFVKMKINKLSQVNVADGTFFCDFTVMLDWYGEILAKEISPSPGFTSFPVDDYFNPEYIIENAFGTSEVKPLPGPPTRTGNFGPGHVKKTHRYKTTLLASELNCDEFPFDSQVMHRNMHQLLHSSQFMSCYQRTLVSKTVDIVLKSHPIREHGRDGVPVRLTDDYNAYRAAQTRYLDRDSLVKLGQRSPRKIDPFHTTSPEADGMPDWDFSAIYGYPEPVVHDNRIHDELSPTIATERFVLHVVIHREPMAAFWGLIFPAGATGILGFVSFALDINALDSRSSIMVTLVLTMVALKFVVANNIPSVPYLTTVDLYTLAVFVIFVEITLLQTASSWMSSTDYEAAQKWDRFFFWISIMQFILVHLWIGTKLMKAQWNMPSKIGLKPKITDDHTYAAKTLNENMDRLPLQLYGPICIEKERNDAIALYEKVNKDKIAKINSKRDRTSSWLQCPQWLHMSNPHPEEQHNETDPSAEVNRKLLSCSS